MLTVKQKATLYEALFKRYRKVVIEAAKLEAMKVFADSTDFVISSDSSKPDGLVNHVSEIGVHADEVLQADLYELADMEHVLEYGGLDEDLLTEWAAITDTEY